MKDSVSLIIPCRNEEKYIANCLDSILLNDYPKEFIEVFVVDGMSNDKTVSIVKEYSKKYPFIKLLENPKTITPCAMNIGIRSSKSKYIIRMDAHSSYPKDYISSLLYWHHKLKADNVGGLWETDVINKNRKSNSIIKVLTNKLGVGNALYRLGVQSPKLVDTVPFGCYKKDIFDKIGLYDEQLKRNQDIELNKRLIKNGGKIYLIPDIKLKYYSRELFSDIAENNFKNGYWTILTTFLTRNLRSLSLRHFVPLLFLLSLIIPLFFVIFNKLSILLSLTFFSLYNLVLLLTTAIINDKTTRFIYIFWGFYTLHFSYAIGSFLGLFRSFALIINKKSKIN